MKIELSDESVETLYVFLLTTNGLYLKDVLKDRFNEGYIKELNGVFSEIYNQIKMISR